jgi:hypothetical protein
VQISPEGNALTAAAWWCLIVSSPLFGFLLLRWLWRYLVWAMLLRELAVLDLRLVATHPDGHGGLAFIGKSPNAYATFVFAVSCVLGAAITHQLLHGDLAPATAGAKARQRCSSNWRATSPAGTRGSLARQSRKVPEKNQQ